MDKFKIWTYFTFIISNKYKSIITKFQKYYVLTYNIMDKLSIIYNLNH